jgi:DNA topoisomerase VI subunit B
MSVTTLRRWAISAAIRNFRRASDDAERAGLTPRIEIVVDAENAVITVADHGSGIAPAVVKKLVDYRVKTSSNAAYVSPTRGQQGNALHSIIPMGCALARGNGWNASVVIIESKGVAHTIRFAVDPVRQTASVSHAKKRSAAKIGTRVTVRWPHEARFLIANAKDDFLSLLATYQWVNPHLTLDATWGDYYSIKASDPGWSKWTPNLATSPHWYDETPMTARKRRQACATSSASFAA